MPKFSICSVTLEKGIATLPILILTGLTSWFASLTQIYVTDQTIELTMRTEKLARLTDVQKELEDMLGEAIKLEHKLKTPDPLLIPDDIKMDLMYQRDKACRGLTPLFKKNPCPPENTYVKLNEESSDKLSQYIQQHRKWLKKNITTIINERKSISPPDFDG